MNDPGTVNRARRAFAVVYLAGGIAVVPVLAAASIPPIRPANEFAKANEVSGVALSPDGKTLACQIGEERTWLLQLRDWESGKIVTVNAGAVPTTPVWLTRERVLFGQGSSVDRDGRNLATGGPAPSTVIFHRVPGGNGDDVLALAFEQPVMGFYQSYFVQRHSHVNRHNTRLGRFVREVENPGKVVLWFPDRNGAVNVAFTDDGEIQSVIHRPSSAAAWVVANGLDGIRNRVRVHGLAGDGKSLWVTMPDEKGRWSLHTYDLGRQVMGEMVLGHDYYDILPRLVLSPNERELLGVRWSSDKLRTFWLHGGMAAVQEALDKALPDTVNHVVSLSDDLQRMVVLAASARNPGVYFQFDRAKLELKPLFAARPWVDPAKMAEMFPASYKSRDGLTIHGYLTVPAGREAKRLPLIVRANPTFWSRVEWGHDTLTQFLANRGYAVLQINPRGSIGYGEDFHRRGLRRIGHEVQQDIADGTRWAITEGIADERRVAILGEGEGGYSALMNLAQNPGVYRAAVSIDGVTDWPAQLRHLGKLHASLLNHMKDRVGDPLADATELEAISPIRNVDRMDAPVLAINGNGEPVPREAARAFQAALRKAKQPHEILAKFDQADGLGVPKVRAEMLGAIEAFLAKHLAPVAK